MSGIGDPLERRIVILKARHLKVHEENESYKGFFQNKINESIMYVSCD